MITQIEVMPRLRDGNRPASYFVSRTQAEIMVARGSAVWVGDFKKIAECSTRAGAGQRKMWKKRPCYNPDDRTVVWTMQLV